MGQIVEEPVTAPATEPVTAAEAKAHMRVSISDDDTLIDGLVAAARQWVEDWCGIAIITQTWKQRRDSFPESDGTIELGRTPLQSVTHVKYVDTDGVEQTVNADDYVVDTDTRKGNVDVAYDATWPTARSQLNAVYTTYVAGFGAAAAVPEPIKLAIKMLAAHWYEHRETVVVGTIATSLQFAIESILTPWKRTEQA